MIATLQRALQAKATKRSHDWWSRYMKEVIPFRGVGIPIIRETVARWRLREGLDLRPVEEQFHLALQLIREPVAEDKLAGILYLQYHLHDQLRWQECLPEYARLFDEGHIFDWNICDWFCVRVLGPAIALHGMPCARGVSSWHTAGNLWRARASVVAFANLTAQGRFHTLVLRSCKTLIRRPERFAKTAVGWIIRELSRHHPKRAERFIESHRRHFSPESLRNATKYLR